MKPLFSMRQALSDPALLADAMKGESLDAWRALLIAGVGEQLTEEERVTFKNFTGRDHEPGAMIDTWLTVSGRRSGKTTTVAVLVVYLACLCDWSSKLNLGERGVALYLAPTTDQAARAFHYARSFIEHSPLMSRLVTNRTATSIELSNGIDIEIQAANWRYVRGSTNIVVVLDESAFLRNEADSANKDEDIVTALRPSLVTTNGRVRPAKPALSTISTSATTAPPAIR
jgi:phage terminase large subunit-like protein